MGSFNPLIPWSELERRLSGRLPLGSPVPDGGDAPGYSRRRQPYRPPAHEPPGARRPAAGYVPYAELHAHSNFSFLDGASNPEELVEEAARLGLEALAITDHDGFYGAVRFAEAARQLGVATVFGAELGLPPPAGGSPSGGRPRAGERAGAIDPEATHLLVLARGPEGYARLSAAIARAQLAGGEKGRPAFSLEELAEAHGGNWCVLTGCRRGAVRSALEDHGPAAAGRELARLIEAFGVSNVVVELTDHGGPLDGPRNDALAECAVRAGVGLVATSNAHYATPARYPLATALGAIRARECLDGVEGWLPAWAGATLRSGAEQARRFRRYPGAVEHAAELGRELAFDLSLVAPGLPPYPVPPGEDEASFLRRIAVEGATRRYGPREREHVPGAWAQIERELEVIESLGFPGYFLVVWDIVEQCRKLNIYCQGRGSAANSAVCYALGITNADAVGLGLLFERFLSRAREGPPDIDLDIESGRRDEIIAYVYERYGREHAAQVANVITYRPRSAVRDVGRALGYPPGALDAWSRQLDAYGPLPAPAAVAPAGRGATAAGGDQAAAQRTAQRTAVERAAAQASVAAAAAPGLGPWVPPPPAPTEHDIPTEVIALAAELEGFPRHLGIHSGGMVICDRPVIAVCPVEWARREGRTVLQWDKDDCAAVGLVKFDLLGLGMLEALHRMVDLVAAHHGVTVELASIPQEDAVYEMLSRADSMGVFQVESRAQMATLPRLRPRTFYDLVVEVALIRPGPIQGGSVHPYLRRRNGEEPVAYLHPLLRPALEKTLGVPLFQEQLMQIAIDVAGFSAADADELRQAMGSKRSNQRMERLRGRLYDGMAARGVTGEIADAVYAQLAAFANFGFPESHSVSFAYLVYASSWLKLRYPDAFLAGLLNSQPMGFWGPQSLVADARRHGVVVRPPDVNASAALATLEPLGAAAGRGEAGGGAAAGAMAVRLGLSGVRGVGEELAEHIVEARQAAGGRFSGIEELVRACGPNRSQIEALATAGAFGALAPSRRAALWAAGALAGEGPGRLPGTASGVVAPPLPEMSPLEEHAADLWATGVTTGGYPLEHLRDWLEARGVHTAAALVAGEGEEGARILVAGVVTHRQRPATAGGTIFLNLEDETGVLNVICSKGCWARHRRVVRGAPALLVRGRLERNAEAISIVAERIEPLELPLAVGRSRDFR